MALRAYQAVYENGTLVWQGDDRPTEHRARVMIIILDSLDPFDDHEDDDWHGLSVAHLQNAYGEDEPEYTISDVKFG